MFCSICVNHFQINTLSYSLQTETKGSPNVKCTRTKQLKTPPLIECEFYYPCWTSIDCESYILDFEPNTYIFEGYGPSGSNYSGGIYSAPRDPSKRGSCLNTEFISQTRGNVICESEKLGKSLSGSGGYSKGILDLKKNAKGFMNLGGRGTFHSGSYCNTIADCTIESQRSKGGYNGGGRGLSGRSSPAGSGATDLRMDSNDLFHRILVAGGGGSSDDDNTAVQYGKEDGSGGAGGGEEAQGFWVNGVYNSTRATQNSGFSFGYGEAAIGIYETPAGSAGWFGGYSGRSMEGGAGGGSGFVLTPSSVLKIPSSLITIKDDLGKIVKTGYYAFLSDSKYFMRDPLLVSGMWKGNGMMRISFYEKRTNLFSKRKKKIISEGFERFHFFLFGTNYFL